MKKQTQATYNVGIYCRLSREDGGGESASIGSQKLMLTEYVTARNWRIVDYYCDDGVSGVGFDRPGLNRMKDDIEAGKINLVICKDLSRLGRNYIEAGHLCEVYLYSGADAYIAGKEAKDKPEKDALFGYLRKVADENGALRLDSRIQAAFDEIIGLLGDKSGLITDFTVTYRRVHGAVKDNIIEFIRMGQSYGAEAA